MNISTLFKICILLLTSGLLSFSGCSPSSTNPVSPESTELPATNEVSFIVADSSQDITGESVWGMYNGIIDPDTLEVSLTPVRKVSAGLPDSAEADITTFLTLVPCLDCVVIQNFSLDLYSRLVMTIGVKHPFLPGNPAEPPSAINRLDLHVFNVRGFIISDGYLTADIFTAAAKTIGGFDLVNADGLSGEFDTYWDNTFYTDANLHPYVLHFDDYTAGNFDPLNENGFTDLNDPQGNLVMKMGSDYNNQDYIFDFPFTGSFQFLFSLTASYGISAVNKNERLSPTYRIPQHNSKAASEVRVTAVEDSDFWAGETTSSCTVTLEIMDINHGVDVGEDINLMSADSSVSRIAVEIPGVTDPIWDTTSPQLFYISGDGRESPLIYDLIITNDKGADVGEYMGLIAVYDSFTGIGNLDGNAIYAVPPNQDPTEAFFTVDEWITYTTFDVEIFQGCGPISGSITSPAGSSMIINNGDTVNFEGTGSSANGGNPIVEYRWKWDDGSGDSFGTAVSHQFTNPNCNGNMDPVTYTVTLTLTDSCEPPNITQVDSINVTVECPDCLDMFEDFDGGTVGPWIPRDWTFSYTDSSDMHYGGWDEFKFHEGMTNCNIPKCASGNCFFTSGDNTAEGNDPGFCNDYSGAGHYYLESPVIDLSEVEVTELTMSVYHFYHLLEDPAVDGCAVYASINGGVSYSTHVATVGGHNYNSAFTSGLRTGDPCFAGLIPGGETFETIFDLTPFIGESEFALRFEQYNNYEGAVGTPGYPVGWWIDDITIYICP